MVHEIQEALVFIPKAFKFNCTVTGQIPNSWDTGRYGIPADIIAQTNCATLWRHSTNPVLCDPYELYMHIHCSVIGTSLGGGMGGTESLFKDHHEKKEVQNDILQEM